LIDATSAADVGLFMTRFVLCVLLLVSTLAAGTAGQQQPVFRSSNEAVPVFVTVTDRNDRIVSGLARDQFQLFDNGKAQPLTLFDNSPQPIRLIVMIDVSGSMARNLPLLRDAADQLFTRLRPDDLARVGTFGHAIAISPTFTKDVAALRAALPTEIPPSAPTPLWKALDQAMGEFKGVDGRHVILVMSDGKDAQFRGFREKFIGQLDVSERAQLEEVMIYAIGVHSRGALPMMGRPGDLSAVLADGFPDPGLGTVALETGGGYLEIRPRDDLAAAFARVADELHSQYLLGFAPPLRDGKRHKIEVRVAARDLKPRARKSYQAPKG
jgi:Ca-activated chloride channel family protein